MREKPNLNALSDDDLLRGLSELVRQSRRVESDLVAHIAKVDARRLYAREAAPSMFEYCTEPSAAPGPARVEPDPAARRTRS